MGGATTWQAVTRVAGWSDFGVVMGSASAALLGLLFVAVSIRAEAIARSDQLRNRAAETMALLLTGLLAAALLTVPDQAKWVLGAEYVALALLATGVAIVLDKRAGNETGNPVGRLLDVALRGLRAGQARSMAPGGTSSPRHDGPGRRRGADGPLVRPKGSLSGWPPGLYAIFPTAP